MNSIGSDPKQFVTIDTGAHSISATITAAWEVSHIDFSISGSKYIIDKDFVTYDRNLKIRRLIADIKSFVNYPPNWDSFGSQPPNEIAIMNAIKGLQILAGNGLFPDKVSPSMEEGIIFEFLLMSNYYLFEFYNDGDIIFLKREDDGLKAMEINLSEFEKKSFEMKYGQYNFEL